MNAVKNIAQYLFVFAVLGVTGYVLYTQAGPLLTPPCGKPIEYSIGSIDPRYGISQSEFESIVKNAASVWNAEAGKPVLAFQASGGMPVSLVYSSVQKATVLGTQISAEQAAFDDAKSKIDALKDRFDALKPNYELKLQSFKTEESAYQAEVDSWNAKGGAPHDVYVELQSKLQSLKADQEAVNSDAATLNTLSNQINNAVTVLNAAAKKINANVMVYNKNAGSDFEQGLYHKDSKGATITINEFKNTADLTRVLAHEFGHAIGLAHVENPASIMYSYNIGRGLGLSPEDIAELKDVCKLQ